MNFGAAFGLTADAIFIAADALKNQLPKALALIEKTSIGTPDLRKQLIEKMEKRWNDSFTLIGQQLSKKQSNGENRKS